MAFKNIYLFLAALGLCWWAWAYSSGGKWGLLFVAVHRLLIAVPSLVVEHRLQASRASVVAIHRLGVVAHGLQSWGSVLKVQGLSCSVECGIFSDQESNPCLLHWQADSYPLYHQGSSRTSVFNKYLDDGDDSRTTLQTTGMWYLPLNKFLMSVFSNLFVFILWMRELELKVVK